MLLELAEEIAIRNGFVSDKLILDSPDGIRGVFADEAIEAGELLVKIPYECLLLKECSPLPAGSSRAAIMIHALSLQYQSPTSPLFETYISDLDDLDMFRACSCLFEDRYDVEWVKRLNSSLCAEIKQNNASIRSLVENLYRFDASIEADTYLLCALHYQSRAVGHHGFVPVIDLFNHSTRYGEAITHKDGAVHLYTSRAYQRGDELCTSYGELDLRQHGIAYNYYDDSDEHFFELGRRLSFNLSDAKSVQIAKTLKPRVNLHFFKKGMFDAYRISSGDVRFSGTGLSTNMKVVAEVFCNYEQASLADKLGQWSHQMLEGIKLPGSQEEPRNTVEKRLLQISKKEVSALKALTQFS